MCKTGKIAPVHATEAHRRSGSSATLSLIVGLLYKQKKCIKYRVLNLKVDR